jgi:hypothetical protein
MTIEAAFTKLFGRGGGSETKSAPETKPEVAVKPKQEQDVSPPAAKPIPWKEEPIWKAYGLDVSDCALD